MDSDEVAKAETDSAAVIAQVFAVACLQAARTGLTNDEAQDCALQFTMRVFHKESQALRSESWMHCCALNYARDFQRVRLRRQHHEGDWPEAIQADGSFLHWDCRDGAPSIETDFIRNEFYERVAAAMARLERIPREVLLRHHLRGESIAQIATDLARSHAAIKQTLFRSRKRLHALLMEQGLDETELCEYLAAIQTPPPPSLWPLVAEFDE